MCGIAGFIDTQRDNPTHLIDRMCKIIRHRGPDDQGVWIGEDADSGIALGMRRLSIIDVSGGHQPIFNEDRSIVIVFNGEIYNYQELRQTLQARGHIFETQCDTEAIVHAYEEFGDECVTHLRGMFAFALWDRKRQRLLAARDRFGKKPLSYYWDGQRLFFGSEIKSLLQAGIPREVNRAALDAYLVYGYVPAPDTLFKGIMKLPPASILTYEHGQIHTKRYWHLPFENTCHDDEATAIERTRMLLEDAVKVRLMSEVPLGAFLSGGVDSSVVVGLMSQTMSQPVKTFSIGFEEEEFTELPYARQVAKHFGTEHHEFLVKSDLISVLPELVWEYDEPFADSSMLPTYYVSKLAREHVTVVLTGDGGDEIFGGYDHYEREYNISRISPLMRYLLAYGSMLIPNGMRGKKRFGNMHRDLATRAIRLISRFPNDTRPTMYTQEYFASLQGNDPYARHINLFKEVSHLDILTQMQAVDVQVYLPDDILVKVDRASMLNSLEARCPLLDHQLAEYVTSLDPSLRIHNGTLKYLLKEVAKDLLPADILARPKQGFGVPIKHWFRGDLTEYARDVLDSPRAHQRGIFNPAFIRNILKEHATTTLVNHSSAIWTLLCLELWFRVYMDEPALDVTSGPQVQTVGRTTFTASVRREVHSMCGICGIYNAQSHEPISPQLIEQMTQLIAHRGPDDNGAYLDGPIGLGFARLSIIDLSGGHQPMCNETGDIWIVFNGEIWNYKTLRSELLEKGHQFRTNCDTETIVHAYEEYGVDCVARLHGMFGFAIWDGPRQRLLLARDRAGKKPLYYTRVDGDLLFASEIKSLLCHPRVRREADTQALADFLSVRYVPAPATLFKNIYKLLPGHWLLYEQGSIHEECYWDYTFGPTEHRSEAEYLQGIREHVHRAVEERMMADVPVGAMLSGGVDSSIISGIMSTLTKHKVKTFSVGFDHPEYSELPYAKLVADHFGTEHHELVVKSSDLTEYWPLLTWHRDEPVSEPSDLGVYLVSKLARQHVKVVLSGEGGDELFAGYPKYVVDWLAGYYHILPASVRDNVIQSLLDRLPYSMRKLKTAARNLSQPTPQRWMNWFGIFNGSLKEQLLSAQTKAEIDLDASRVFQTWLQKNPQRDDLSSMLYLDTKIWLPDNLLMKGDKMTMAASLEARIPLLDDKLTEYAASIPSHLKIKSFRAKYMLKQAFADFLPETILTRKKMGFNVPTGVWFREGQRGFITNLLLSERTRSRGYFNDAFIARMVHDHMEGTTNYQAQLFTLASLELWFRVFIDSPQLVIPQGSVETFLDDDHVGTDLSRPLGVSLSTRT